MTDKAKTATTGERIAKVMARAGLCSRREAEAWIAAGRVAVNGVAVTSPALNVTGRDRISIDGQPLPQRERTRLFLYHKPRGLVTTHADPQGRPTIFAALPTDLPRLISVGRLDLTTEGLLLLTNDGGLARVLELPTTGWLRRYRVRAHGSVTLDALERLRPGVTIDGVRYGPIEATLDRVQGSNLWLTLGIREGKNREVRNVLAHLGLTVNRLIRVSFGPFQLGDLAEGTVEEVKTRILRDQLGERLAKEAGADFAAPADAKGHAQSSSSARRAKTVNDAPRSATRSPKGSDRAGGTARAQSSRPAPRPNAPPQEGRERTGSAATTRPQSTRAKPKPLAGKGKPRRPHPTGRGRR